MRVSWRGVGTLVSLLECEYKPSFVPVRTGLRPPTGCTGTRRSLRVADRRRGVATSVRGVEGEVRRVDPIHDSGDDDGGGPLSSHLSGGEGAEGPLPTSFLSLHCFRRDRDRKE